MKTIFLSLALLMAAAHADAQDWERVFGRAEAPDPGFEILILDPSMDSGDGARYRRLPLGSVGLTAWASTRRSGDLLNVSPTGPVWSLLLFEVSSPIEGFVDPDTPVRVLIEGEGPEVLYAPGSGQAAVWGSLETDRLHVMMRAAGRLILVR